MITGNERETRKADSRTGGPKPFYYSLGIHGLLLIFLGFSIHWSWKDDNAGIMIAKVVDGKPAKNKSTPKTEKKKKQKKKDKKADNKKLEKKKEQQAALKLKKINDTKRAKEKKRKEQAAARKRMAEDSLRVINTTLQ